MCVWQTSLVFSPAVSVGQSEVCQSWEQGIRFSSCTPVSGALLLQLELRTELEFRPRHWLEMQASQMAISHCSKSPLIKVVFKLYFTWIFELSPYFLQVHNGKRKAHWFLDFLFYFLNFMQKVYFIITTSSSPFPLLGKKHGESSYHNLEEPKLLSNLRKKGK